MGCTARNRDLFASCRDEDSMTDPRVNCTATAKLIDRVQEAICALQCAEQGDTSDCSMALVELREVLQSLPVLDERIAQLEAENEALRHDIARHVEIAAAEATRSGQLEALLRDWIASENGLSVAVRNGWLINKTEAALAGEKDAAGREPSKDGTVSGNGPTLSQTRMSEAAKEPPVTAAPAQEPDDDTLERMVEAYQGYLSPVDRGLVQHIEAMRLAWRASGSQYVHSDGWKRIDTQEPPETDNDRDTISQRVELRAATACWHYPTNSWCRVEADEWRSGGTDIQQQPEDKP